MIKIAVPKGRLFKETVDFLRSKNVVNFNVEEGRRLIVECDGITLLLVKPFDVPVYVEHGSADLGICGYDVYLEKEPNVYRLVDLGIGRCRIAVAGKPSGRVTYLKSSYIRVATKYENVAKKFFSRKGVKAEILVLSGSVEIAPVLGLSEFIVDLVQTGKTLRENGLIEVDKIDDSSAWLICNRASFRNKRSEIVPLIKKLSGQALQNV